VREGHTIHRVARDHTKRFAGQEVEVSSPQGRFRAGARKLDGSVLEEVEAYGKHLFYRWENSHVLHVHLGLYGKFRSHRCPAPDPRGQVRLRVVGQQHAFDLNGPTACEIVGPGKYKKILARLGQDPLRRDADPDAAWQRISKSRAAIGKLLLDQSVIAGIGNVFRADALFAIGMHPERVGKKISRCEFEMLWETLVRFLKTGVKYNRIITADPDEIGKTPGRMNRAERLLIYKKQRCGRCDQEVESWELGARTIYACLNCQT